MAIAEFPLQNRISTARFATSGRITNCPHYTGSLHRDIYFSPGMAEALPDSESRRCGSVRFGVPDVQKCRRGFCSVRRPLPQGHPAGVLERAPHRHRDLQKSPVRQHCHDRDKCGLHLEGYQRIFDGLGKGADQAGL